VKIKWKKDRRKHGFDYISSNFRNFVAVLEEQFDVVDKKGKEVKWMRTIRYNSGHVGCPSWGYGRTVEEAKEGAEAWLHGYGSALCDLKMEIELQDWRSRSGPFWTRPLT